MTAGCTRTRSAGAPMKGRVGEDSAGKGEAGQGRADFNTSHHQRSTTEKQRSCPITARKKIAYTLVRTGTEVRLFLFLFFSPSPPLPSPPVPVPALHFTSLWDVLFVFDGHRWVSFPFWKKRGACCGAEESGGLAAQAPRAAWLVRCVNPVQWPSVL